MNNWRRLADLAIARRVELGMVTQGALAEKTRLTRRLLSDIEHARRENYDPATLARLERGLQWLPGSVQAVLDGGQPTPLPDERPTPGAEAPDEMAFMSMLVAADLPIADMERIIAYIRARRTQQHQQLADEVYDLIREAGGTLPPRPRGRDRSGDDAPHLYLDRGVPLPGLGGNARVPHGDLPQ